MLSCYINKRASYISRDLKGDEYSFPNKIKSRCSVPTFFDDVHIFGLF